jgi:thiamine-phosphate pyrophosphorylase
VALGRLSPLYAIVDVGACAAAGLAPLDAAGAYLRAGVTLLQLRAKEMDGAGVLALADALTRMAAASGARVVVNDRLDVARSASAGVHLGQQDLPPAVARRILGAEAIVGLSTHTPAELAAAVREDVSYVAVGPVFATSTKVDPDPVVGLDGVRQAALAARAAGLPLVAIGGISLATARQVLDAGADSVAVISDLLRNPGQLEARARAFFSTAGR